MGNNAMKNRAASFAVFSPQLPPCRIMERLIDNFIPKTSPLVRKNGSNIYARLLWAIPFQGPEPWLTTSLRSTMDTCQSPLQSSPATDE
jgi:hypothetical protein